MSSAVLTALLPTLRIWLFAAVVYFTTKFGLPETAANGVTDWLLNGFLGPVTFLYGPWAAKREWGKA